MQEARFRGCDMVEGYQVEQCSMVPRIGWKDSYESIISSLDGWMFNRKLDFEIRARCLVRARQSRGETRRASGGGSHTKSMFSTPNIYARSRKK